MRGCGKGVFGQTTHSNTLTAVLKWIHTPLSTLLVQTVISLHSVLSLPRTGTGKTMLAKAVAHHTTASFIRVVGSEFVQKYLGEV